MELTLLGSAKKLASNTRLILLEIIENIIRYLKSNWIKSTNKTLFKLVVLILVLIYFSTDLKKNEKRSSLVFNLSYLFDKLKKLLAQSAKAIVTQTTLP